MKGKSVSVKMFVIISKEPKFLVDLLFFMWSSVMVLQAFCWQSLTQQVPVIAQHRPEATKNASYKLHTNTFLFLQFIYFYILFLGQHCQLLTACGPDNVSEISHHQIVLIGHLILLKTL